MAVSVCGYSFRPIFNTQNGFMEIKTTDRMTFVYYVDFLYGICLDDEYLGDLIATGDVAPGIGFALSAGEMRSIRFEHDDKFIEIKPGATGLPTIRDMDVLLYCASCLAPLVKVGHLKVWNLNRMRINVKAFLAFCRRGTGGSRNAELIQSLDRLSGSVLSTNIPNPDDRNEEAATPFLSYDLERNDAGSIETVLITFPINKIYRLMSHPSLGIELHPDYFSLRPLQRVVYLLAKSNCGTGCPWTVSAGELHRLTGASSPLRKFKLAIQEIRADSLPEFTISVNEAVTEIEFVRLDAETPAYTDW